MPELESLVRRHGAFWKHEDATTPLIRVSTRRSRKRFENVDVTPDMLDVRLLTQDIGKNSMQHDLVQGDLFHSECPFSRIPWMEALVGCEIHSGTDEAMWPKPALRPDYEGLERIVPSDDNPWLVKLLALTKALVDANDGSYLVTHTLQRGPVDMLSALLGDERMGLALYDAPARVTEILARTAQALVKVARAQFELIPSFHGGWVSWSYGLLAPGSVIRFQSDSSSQLSPHMYEQYVHPHDKTVMQAFDYSILDLHSAGTLHIYKVLMATEELDAISITMDRYANAPTVRDLLPTFAEILEAKSLLITGEMTQEEVDLAREALPPKGLAINAHLVDRLLWEREV